MNTYATFDRSQFPLIVVTFTGEKETPENFEVYLDGLLANYKRKEAFALVFDASDAPPPNLKYQQKQASWMKAHKALIQQYCKGVAYALPGIFLRNILKLIFKIQKNPVPFKVFASKEVGIAWAKAQLANPA